MKIELNLSWFLHKVRLFFLIGVFYALYMYTQPVFAFMWIIYFLLNDLSEIIEDIDKVKHESSSLLNAMSFKRKGF